MTVDPFFEDPLEQSTVKATIVQKYFWAWANVIIGVQNKQKQVNPRIAYLDLFAGPGRYVDGTSSTPLLVLEKAIADAQMRDRLVAMFNDAYEIHSRSLEEEIQKLPGIETLKFAPQVGCEEVGTRILEMFEKVRLVPTLFFVDPWGYKGLSLKLINSVLKNWGCDCIFFFNYNRINAGISNSKVKAHMDALFGEVRAESLREKVKNLSPADRELAVVEELAEALKELGGKFVLPFRFVNERGTRTSHHLIFVSKDFKGYEIMKEVMYGMSSSKEQGVASFDYNPADVRFPLLFELNRPLDGLAEELLKTLAGKKLKMEEIFQGHNVGTPFVKRNYKAVLLELEAAGKISTNPSKRKKGTFADHVDVEFPQPL